MAKYRLSNEAKEDLIEFIITELKSSEFRSRQIL